MSAHCLTLCLFRWSLCIILVRQHRKAPYSVALGSLPATNTPAGIWTWIWQSCNRNWCRATCVVDIYIEIDDIRLNLLCLTRSKKKQSPNKRLWLTCNSGWYGAVRWQAWSSNFSCGEFHVSNQLILSYHLSWPFVKMISISFKFSLHLRLSECNRAWELLISLVLCSKSQKFMSISLAPRLLVRKTMMPIINWLTIIEAK